MNDAVAAPAGQSWKVTLPCTRAEAEALDGDIAAFAVENAWEGNYEHGGGVKLAKEATDAQVAVGAGDAEAVDADIGEGSKVVDKPLHDDEVFDLGGRHLRAVATPGHTRGTFCYLQGDLK